MAALPALGVMRGRMQGRERSGRDGDHAVWVPAFAGTTAGAHPERRLLVFCFMLPWSPCSRMLFFSSSRWPLVVSRGTPGLLPGPLWLWLSSGMGGVVLVMMVSVMKPNRQRTPRRDGSLGAMAERCRRPRKSV